jgi:hypothetical protein
LRSGKGLLFCTLSAGNLLLLAWGAMKHFQEGAKADKPWLLAATGLATSAYILAMAPNPRFGLGLLALGWFGLASLATQRLGERAREALPQWAPAPPTLAVVGVAAILAVVSFWPLDSWRRALNASSRQPFVAASAGHFNWLMPAQVPAIAFARRQSGGASSTFPIHLAQDKVDGFTYSYPINTDICGPAPLPASPRRLTHIALADPSRGLAGGFVTIP